MVSGEIVVCVRFTVRMTTVVCGWLLLVLPTLENEGILSPDPRDKTANKITAIVTTKAALLIFKEAKVGGTRKDRYVSPPSYTLFR